ncbi:MAG: LacI family transcriptional regulator [Oscillospiraceae bacterium]|nr:LacI family transcriptional regulator [Oscillospiraceae bacterium]
MTTLKDIAKTCELSVTQVSRALNDCDDVSISTKIKVRKVAEELNYVKNINARRLVLKKSNQISVIICGFDRYKKDNDNILMTVLNGIYNFAESINYEIVPFFVSKKNDESYLQYCKSRLINGIIFIGARSDDEKFLEIINSDFPCVTIDTLIKGKNKASILIDDEYYSELAVSEMINRGYKKIGMINGHEFAHVSLERQRGYESALKKHRIHMDESLIKCANFEFNEASLKAKELIDENVDGIFCASDMMALGALDEILKNNLKVPDDIALFGFDGLLITEFTNPKISTIAQDNFKKGYEAARILHKIVKRESYEKKVFVDCEIKITNSIGLLHNE